MKQIKKDKKGKKDKKSKKDKKKHSYGFCFNCDAMETRTIKMTRSEKKIKALC